MAGPERNGTGPRAWRGPGAAGLALAVGGFGAWPEPLPAGEQLRSFGEASAWLDRLREAPDQGEKVPVQMIASPSEAPIR